VLVPVSCCDCDSLGKFSTVALVSGSVLESSPQALTFWNFSEAKRGFVAVTMAASKVMADRRLQNILSHLSPPVTSASSDSPHSSRLGHVGEFRGSFGAVEDDVLCQEIECRRPNTDREAKLIENLMLSRLRRFYTHRNAAGSHSELRLVPCRGESKSLHMAEEHVEVETRELENSEPSHGAGDDGDGKGDLSKRAETVRAGITSASAVSSSGAAKPRGHLTVAVCEFCDIIQGASPCIKVCLRFHPVF
jgi:hypothetical protein